MFYVNDQVLDRKSFLLLNDEESKRGLGFFEFCSKIINFSGSFQDKNPLLHMEKARGTLK